MFLDREIWEPAIDPAVMRLSLKVHWWQLGSDEDTSFVGFPQLSAKVAEVKKALARYGEEAKVGLVWESQKTLPECELPTWDFVSLASDPAATLNQTSESNAKAPRTTGPRHVACVPCRNRSTRWDRARATLSREW